jgi:hypothetical protein
VGNEHYNVPDAHWTLDQGLHEPHPYQGQMDDDNFDTLFAQDHSFPVNLYYA